MLMEEDPWGGSRDAFEMTGALKRTTAVEQSERDDLGGHAHVEQLQRLQFLDYRALSTVRRLREWIAAGQAKAGAT